MKITLVKVLLFSLQFAVSVWGSVLNLKERDRTSDVLPSTTESDVECFSEYMDLGIHQMEIEGLIFWLSENLRIQVNLLSMKNLNNLLASCGFSLHQDLDRNYIFRVTYSGCFVQLEDGNHVLLNPLQRGIRFGERVMMKCPVVPSPPNREHIQCDPDFIQVTREIPVDSWSKELEWSLALSGSLVVALEDSSLIQVNVEMHKPNITVQGRRDGVLTPVQDLKSKGHFLPLKLVSGHYAYSMEATCPPVNQSSCKDTVLCIYKRLMGLTRRGDKNETLTVSSVTVEQTDSFTWSDRSEFLQLYVPTSDIQQTRVCDGRGAKIRLQSFYKIDAVLTFRETSHKMHWTLENTSACSDADGPLGVFYVTITDNSTSSQTDGEASQKTNPSYLINKGTPVTRFHQDPSDNISRSSLLAQH